MGPVSAKDLYPRIIKDTFTPLDANVAHLVPEETHPFVAAAQPDTLVVSHEQRCSGVNGGNEVEVGDHSEYGNEYPQQWFLLAIGTQAEGNPEGQGDHADTDIDARPPADLKLFSHRHST